MDKIKSILVSTGYSKNKIYLLEAFNNNAGLFLHDDKVLFAEKTDGKAKSSKIETVNLTLITKLCITAINDNSTFLSGQYNAIYFNEDYKGELFESFKRLCFVYSTNNISDFEGFFYSLISIFQLPSQTKNRNAIGLFGELSLIKEVWEKYEFDLTNYWHIDGVESKYDFQLPLMNIEVKTTSLEKNSFSIKHSQIFNKANNFLVLIKMSKGKLSLQELIDYFKNNTPFKMNYIFQINLHSSLAELSTVQLEKKLEVSEFYAYHCDKLETISDIPECINNIIYDYTFDLNKSIKLSRLIEIISSQSI